MKIKLQKARYIQPSTVLLEGSLVKFQHCKSMQLRSAMILAKSASEWQHDLLKAPCSNGVNLCIFRFYTGSVACLAEWLVCKMPLGSWIWAYLDWKNKKIHGVHIQNPKLSLPHGQLSNAIWDQAGSGESKRFVVYRCFNHNQSLFCVKSCNFCNK